MQAYRCREPAGNSRIIVLLGTRGDGYFDGTAISIQSGQRGTGKICPLMRLLDSLWNVKME